MNTGFLTPENHYDVEVKNMLLFAKNYLKRQKIALKANAIGMDPSYEYLIRKSIVQLEEELDNDFYKSHRSCLVNINNIIKVDFDNNIIHFKNKEINLISRSNRKGLKTRMENKYEN